MTNFEIKPGYKHSVVLSFKNPGIHYLNDTKNGIGKEYFLDGSSYEGMYQNGKKNGKGIINNTYIT